MWHFSHPNERILVPVTEIPFSQAKIRPISVPILPRQDPHSNKANINLQSHLVSNKTNEQEKQFWKDSKKKEYLG